MRFSEICDDGAMGRSGEASRRSVVAAVGRIVRRKGLEGIRIREIATEAEVSPGAVLYHFPNNSDLLFAVHEETVASYLAGRVAAAEAATDPRERIVAVLRAGVPPWTDEDVIRVLYELHGLARRSEKHAALLSELWRREHELYVSAIEAGVAAGVFTVAESPEDIASRLLALEDGLVLHLIGDNSALSADEVVRHVLGYAGLALGCTVLVAS